MAAACSASTSSRIGRGIGVGTGRGGIAAGSAGAAGAGVRERADAAREAGEYLASHALQALALETAEAAAEWLHAKLRADWGFPDPPGLTMKDCFAARYRGKRYSFGYPACPDMSDQEKSLTDDEEFAKAQREIAELSRKPGSFVSERTTPISKPTKTHERRPCAIVVDRRGRSGAAKADQVVDGPL